MHRGKVHKLLFLELAGGLSSLGHEGIQMEFTKHSLFSRGQGLDQL